MKDARIARQILEAIEILNDLLWDRYADQLLEIYSREQQDGPCRQDDPFDI